MMEEKDFFPCLPSGVLWASSGHLGNLLSEELCRLGLLLRTSRNKTGGGSGSALDFVVDIRQPTV